MAQILFSFFPKLALDSYPYSLVSHLLDFLKLKTLLAADSTKPNKFRRPLEAKQANELANARNFWLRSIAALNLHNRQKKMATMTSAFTFILAFVRLLIKLQIQHPSQGRWHYTFVCLYYFSSLYCFCFCSYCL